MIETLISTSVYDLIRYNYIPDGDAVIYVTSRNFDGGAQTVYETLNRTISFYELRVDNWDDNLTPWQADPKMKGRTFGGASNQLLESVVTEVIPLLKISNSKVYIAGYSLAGLFSLWALYNSNAFSGCACCSGSLWYPGWIDYAKTHKVAAERIYLSIGNREKNSKNEYMKRVDEAYTVEYELLCSANIDAHFDINEGGHFNDVNNRVVKGINWILGGKNEID